MVCVYIPDVCVCVCVCVYIPDVCVCVCMPVCVCVCGGGAFDSPNFQLEISLKVINTPAPQYFLTV